MCWDCSCVIAVLSSVFSRQISVFACARRCEIVMHAVTRLSCMQVDNGTSIETQRVRLAEALTPHGAGCPDHIILHARFPTLWSRHQVVLQSTWIRRTSFSSTLCRLQLYRSDIRINDYVFDRNTMCFAFFTASTLLNRRNLWISDACR